MSLSGPPAASLPRGGTANLTARTAIVAAAALAVVFAAGLLAPLLIGPVNAPLPPRSPFGVGLREGAGAPGNGLVAWILAVQSDFYRQLTASVRAITQGAGGGVWGLAGLSFLYGVFHAAGPGHGKAVISAWIVANERALGRGILLAFAAAAVQALVAIALVVALSVVLRVTAATMTGVTGAVETASFAAVAVVGAILLWRKASGFARRAWPGLAIAHDHAPGEACGPGCGHVHMPSPAVAAGPWSGAVGAVLAAGIRPCSGAIIVMVFALSQGVFAAGILATLAMAGGTALVTGALAALAVFFKQGALQLAAGTAGRGLALAGLEVLAAAVVLAFGAALLLGVATAGGG